MISACVGENYLYVLCDGKVYSRNKGENDDFSVVYMSKDYKFKTYHCKRDEIEICYLVNCNESFYCVSTRDDIFEWKAPSTQASYIGTIPAICDIACGLRHGIACTFAGDVYVWGENKFKAINQKLRQELNEITSVDNTNSNLLCNNGKRTLTKAEKAARIEKLPNITQVARVECCDPFFFLLRLLRIL